jgi:hypothetical protein
MVKTMAPLNTVPQPDRSLPHPARENRSHLFATRQASSSGESQTKTHSTAVAGTSLAAAD